MALTVNQSAIGPLEAIKQTYTPAWSGAGTPPAIGNGTITGEYFQIGKLVHLKIKLTMGSTTSYGNSSWTFTLPVTAAAADWSGSARAYDNGTGWYMAGCYVTTTALLSPYYAFNGNTMTAAHPHTWASGDELVMSITYEAA